MEVQSHDAFLALLSSALGLLFAVCCFGATAVQTLLYSEYTRLHSVLLTVSVGAFIASVAGLGRFAIVTIYPF
jgi:hypothetical protein